MEELKVRKTARRGGALLLLLGLILGTFAMVSGPASADGNNGTVKINGVALADKNSDKGNDPHVQCPLTVTWDGFDAGKSHGTTVTIGEQPFQDGDAPVYTTATTFQGATYSLLLSDLNLNSLIPSKNGYHLDFVITTELSTGVSTQKEKVIWVEAPCGSEPNTQSGLLDISKVVAQNESAAHPGPYDFSVQCGTDPATTVTLSANDSTATVVDTPEGPTTCVVGETGDGGATSTTVTSNDDTATFGTAPVSATVKVNAGETTTVEFTNSFASEQPGTATLRIAKTVVGTGTGPYTFTVDCGDSTLSTSTVSLSGGDHADVIVSAPPASSCTVTETVNGGANSTTWAVDDGTATSGTVASTRVAPNQTTTITFTNTFTGSTCTSCGSVIIPTPEVPVVAPEVITPAPETPAPAAPVVESTTVQAPPPAAPTVVEGVQLARTGVDTKPLLEAAGLCLLLGGLALLAGRKEQVATPTR